MASTIARLTGRAFAISADKRTDPLSGSPKRIVKQVGVSRRRLLLCVAK
jgi:hypothetical protein